MMWCHREAISHPLSNLCVIRFSPAARRYDPLPMLVPIHVVGGPCRRTSSILSCPYSSLLLLWPSIFRHFPMKYLPLLRSAACIPQNVAFLYCARAYLLKSTAYFNRNQIGDNKDDDVFLIQEVFVLQGQSSHGALAHSTLTVC